MVKQSTHTLHLIYNVTACSPSVSSLIPEDPGRTHKHASTRVSTGTLVPTPSGCPSTNLEYEKQLFCSCDSSPSGKLQSTIGCDHTVSCTPNLVSARSSQRRHVFIYFVVDIRNITWTLLRRLRCLWLERDNAILHMNEQDE